MKSTALVLLGIVLAVCTVAVGVVHGTLTNRWGPQPDMVAAASLLERVPEKLPGWTAVRDLELDPHVRDMLQCAGAVQRTYENDKTGEQVSVFVLLGPSGPIAVHTPEICYSSKDYRITADRQAWSFSDQESLWDLRLKHAGLSGAPLRVLYAWTNDGNWQATQHPRFAFGGRPLLYKIQLAGPPPLDENRDACRDFLGAFLPALREHLVVAK